jgi:hypothetical protein
LLYEPPYISEVWPDVGDIQGGTPVYLMGTGMTLGLAQHITCKFGTIEVTARVIAPSNQIKCISPAQSAGTGTVELRVSVDGLEYFGGVWNGPYFHYHVSPSFSDLSVEGTTYRIVGRDNPTLLTISGADFPENIALADGYPLCRFTFSTTNI